MLWERPAQPHCAQTSRGILAALLFQYEEELYTLVRAFALYHLAQQGVTISPETKDIIRDSAPSDAILTTQSIDILPSGRQVIGASTIIPYRTRWSANDHLREHDALTVGSPEARVGFSRFGMRPAGYHLRGMFTPLSYLSICSRAGLDWGPLLQNRSKSSFVYAVAVFGRRESYRIRLQREWRTCKVDVILPANKYCRLARAHYPYRRPLRRLVLALYDGPTTLPEGHGRHSRALLVQYEDPQQVCAALGLPYVIMICGSLRYSPENPHYTQPHSARSDEAPAAFDAILSKDQVQYVRGIRGRDPS
ncbi:hypothetical protein B0H17DRAFT_1207379 [Mycena rosella]|uniref:Uncharacterized protein n=1 Tax=Mycena rosella TaxID=1033263 RepID=A0AAD7D3A2_MYCRO|nr:hypothetical protein B0H17DRAFT_1207379 [Mycena rosella]